MKRQKNVKGGGSERLRHLQMAQMGGGERSTVQTKVVSVLEIVASDMAIHPEQRKTARQHFRIRIRDVNTHSPVFDQSGYRISLAEVVTSLKMMTYLDFYF